MVDLANSSFKLLAASQCQGICWWPNGFGFEFSALSFSFTDSRFFIESCILVEDTAPL